MPTGQADDRHYIPVNERENTDPRVIGNNGVLLRSRQIVLEALDVGRDKGMTLDDICDLVGRDLPGSNPRQSAGKTLGSMRADGHVIEMRGRWYLIEYAPQPKNAPPRSAPNGRAEPIAPMVGKREGRTISVYTTPHIIQNVIGITITIEDKAYKVPLFANYRICIGREAIIWAAEQESYTHVNKIRLLLKGGQTEELTPAYTDIVTIAPEET